MLESHKNAKPHSTRGISPVYITVQAVGRYTVLILSVIMIVWITRDTLEGISMATSARYMHFQFWVCVFFLADILIETFGAPRGRRLRWLARHWLFVMVSVPWLTLFQWSGITLGNTVAYIIKFIPMIRTGYVVALVTGPRSSLPKHRILPQGCNPTPIMLKMSRKNPNFAPCQKHNSKKRLHP